MGRSWRRGCAFALALGALLGAPTRAAADEPAPALVVIDAVDDTVQLAEEDGTSSGTLGVTNLNADELELELEPADATAIAGCTFRLEPSTVAPGRSASVKIETECDLPKNGAFAELSLGGGLEPISLAVKPKDEAEGIDAGSILCWFFLAAILSAVCAVVMWCRRPMVEVPAPAVGGDPTKQKVPWNTPIPGIDAKWSLSDSWASNLTLLTTGFAAVFGATEILEALLGDDGKTAVGRALIASAAGGLLVAAAPLALKGLGKGTNATPFGLVLAAWLTLTGVVGQMATIGWALAETDGDKAFRTAGAVGAGIFAVALLVYGVRTIGVLLDEAFLLQEEEEVTDGLLVAAATLYGPRATNLQGAATDATSLLALLEGTGAAASPRGGGGQQQAVTPLSVATQVVQRSARRPRRGRPSSGIL